MPARKETENQTARSNNISLMFARQYAPLSFSGTGIPLKPVDKSGDNLPRLRTAMFGKDVRLHLIKFYFI